MRVIIQTHTGRVFFFFFFFYYDDNKLRNGINFETLLKKSKTQKTKQNYLSPPLKNKKTKLTGVIYPPTLKKKQKQKKQKQKKLCTWINFGAPGSDSCWHHEVGQDGGEQFRFKELGGRKTLKRTNQINVL